MVLFIAYVKVLPHVEDLVFIDGWTKTYGGNHKKEEELCFGLMGLLKRPITLIGGSVID